MNEIKENAIKRKFNIYKELYYRANSGFRTRLLLLLFPYIPDSVLILYFVRQGAREEEQTAWRHREDVWNFVKRYKYFMYTEPHIYIHISQWSKWK